MSNSWMVNNNVFVGAGIGVVGVNVGGSYTITNNYIALSSSANAGSASVAVSGGSSPPIFSGNYIYSDYNNPHTWSYEGLYSNNDEWTLEDNIFEIIYNADGANIFPPRNNAVATTNITGNILIGCGTLAFSTGPVALDAWNIEHNTILIKETSAEVYGSIYGLETSGDITGDVNIRSNIVAYVSGVSPSIYSRAASDISNNAPSTVTAGDYNDWSNITTDYYQISVSGGSDHDIDIDPQFVDENRALVTWDSEQGSNTGTKESAENYLLAINGYNTTTKTQSDTPSVQGPSDLVTWVQAGFAPTNAALRGTAHDDGDIGAVANSNTAPSLAYTSPDTWNTGDMTITYSLTDADSDTNTLTVQYSTDNSNWSTATQGSGGDGTTGLTSSSGGTSHTFVWDTATDLPTTEDSTVYIKITPSDGGGGLTAYTTDSFGVDNVNPTVSAGSDQTKTASFTQTATATDSGGINASTYQWAKVSGPGTLTFGTATALSTTISADTDGTYVISFTASDNAGNSNSDTFTLAWSTATATTAGGGAPSSLFFDISVSAGPNGKISPSWGLMFYSGTSQTFNITPNPGYQITDVLVDGVSIGAQPSYTFSSINNPHSISATFSKIGTEEQTGTTQQTTQTEQSTNSQQQENTQTTTQTQTSSQKEAVIAQLKQQLITLITQVIQMLYEQIALMKS